MHVASGLHVLLRQACLARTATGLQRNWCRPNRNGRSCSRTEEPGEQRFCHHQRLNSQWDCLFPSGPTFSFLCKLESSLSTIQRIDVVKTQALMRSRQLFITVLPPGWPGKASLGQKLATKEGGILV